MVSHSTPKEHDTITIERKRGTTDHDMTPKTEHVAFSERKRITAPTIPDHSSPRIDFERTVRGVEAILTDLRRMIYDPAVTFQEMESRVDSIKRTIEVLGVCLHTVKRKTNI